MEIALTGVAIIREDLISIKEIVAMVLGSPCTEEWWEVALQWHGSGLLLFLVK